jgi:hypothetical protein
MPACNRSAKTKTFRATSCRAPRRAPRTASHRAPCKGLGRRRVRHRYVRCFTNPAGWLCRGFFLAGAALPPGGCGLRPDACKPGPCICPIPRDNIVNNSHQPLCPSGITCIALPKYLFLNRFSRRSTFQCAAKSLISLKNFVAAMLPSQVFLLQWKKVQISGEKCPWSRFPGRSGSPPSWEIHPCSKVPHRSVSMRRVGFLCRLGIVTSWRRRPRGSSPSPSIRTGA